MALPGVQTAVAANIRKNPASVRKSTVPDSGDSKPTVKARASEAVRTAAPASAENAKTARTETKLSKHYEISESIRKGTTGAVRSNMNSKYGVPTTVDYSTFDNTKDMLKAAKEYSDAQLAKQLAFKQQQQANMYAQLNQMYANQMKAQLGAQLGKSAVNFLNNLGSIGGKDNVYSDMSLSDLSSSRSASSVKTPADLTSASGVKSAVKNADTSADVYNAKQAADEIRGNLTNELSKLDMSESINAKLDGSIGVDGSDKTLADVLKEVGVTLDTSALGKIQVNTEDTSQIISSITQKMESVDAFAKTLEGSTAKITTKSGEVKGTLTATTMTIERLEGEIATAQAQGLDTSTLQTQLDKANEQKSKLEIQLKELDAAKKAVGDMSTEATTMQNELKEMKGKFEDLQEVETTADEKQQKLEQKEQKELTKLEKEAYDLKNKMDAEKDEGKKAKLKDKYDKTCAEFNEIAANTTLENFAGRSIGDNATDSRTVYEQLDDKRQAGLNQMKAQVDADMKRLNEEAVAQLDRQLAQHLAPDQEKLLSGNVNITINRLQQGNDFESSAGKISFNNGQYSITDAGGNSRPISEDEVRKEIAATLG